MPLDPFHSSLNTTTAPGISSKATIAHLDGNFETDDRFKGAPKYTPCMAQSYYGDPLSGEVSLYIKPARGRQCRLVELSLVSKPKFSNTGKYKIEEIIYADCGRY